MMGYLILTFLPGKNAPVHLGWDFWTGNFLKTSFLDRQIFLGRIFNFDLLCVITIF